jgi:hypothetical protein
MKSKRVPQDGAAMLERAQHIIRENNLEVMEGKKKVSPPFSVSDLLHVASSIDVVVPTVELDKINAVHNIIDTEITRNGKFSVECSFQGCSDKHGLGGRCLDDQPTQIDLGAIDAKLVGTSKVLVQITGGSLALENSHLAVDDEGEDPQTPTLQEISVREISVLEAELEKAWTRVVNRKKNKNRK